VVDPFIICIVVGTTQSLVRSSVGREGASPISHNDLFLLLHSSINHPKRPPNNNGCSKKCDEEFQIEEEHSPVTSASAYNFKSFGNFSISVSDAVGWLIYHAVIVQILPHKQSGSINKSFPLEWFLSQVTQEWGGWTTDVF